MLSKTGCFRLNDVGPLLRETYWQAAAQSAIIGINYRTYPIFADQGLDDGEDEIQRLLAIGLPAQTR